MTNFDTNIVVMQSILISQDSTRTDGMYGVNFGVKNIWNTTKVPNSKLELVYLLSWLFFLAFLLRSNNMPSYSYLQLNHERSDHW